MAECHGLGICLVTFDQPLYVKVVEIIISSHDLPNILVHLGGFHFLISYMGSLGFIRAGNGLDSMWQTVYAPNSIQNTLTEHAYSWALRAHILSSAAISSALQETPWCLTRVNIDRLQNIKEEFLDSLLREECLHKLPQSWMASWCPVLQGVEQANCGSVTSIVSISSGFSSLRKALVIRSFICFA